MEFLRSFLRLSFRGQTSSGVTKCRLFSKAINSGFFPPFFISPNTLGQNLAQQDGLKQRNKIDKYVINWDYWVLWKTKHHSCARKVIDYEFMYECKFLKKCNENSENRNNRYPLCYLRILKIWLPLNPPTPLKWQFFLHSVYASASEIPWLLLIISLPWQGYSFLHLGPI